MGDTVLHLAARCIDNPEIVKLIMKYVKDEAKAGGLVSLLNERGEIALDIADRRQSTEIVKQLLQYAQDLTVKDKNEHTALYYYSHDLEMYKLFCQSGAIPDQSQLNKDLDKLFNNTHHVYDTQFHATKGGYYNKLKEDFPSIGE